MPPRLSKDMLEMILDLQVEPRPPDSKALGRELAGFAPYPDRWLAYHLSGEGRQGDHCSRKASNSRYIYKPLVTHRVRSLTRTWQWEYQTKN